VNPVAILTPADLAAYDPDIPVAKAEAMIRDVLAQAVLAAPCLADEAELTAAQIDQARSVLTAAVLRLNDQGPAAVVTTSATDVAGPYTRQESTTVDNRSVRVGLLWPSEIDLLRQICGKPGRGGMVDAAPEPVEPDGGPVWDFLHGY
jgi:hypothetical protein